MALSMILLGGIPVALIAIPVPPSVVAIGVLGTQGEVFLRAESPGSLEALPAAVGSAVDEGETLLTPKDPAAVTRLAEVKARLVAAR
jgi:multidrug efflux pump subunit AcrA (membrane-fusion protein)